MKERKEIKITEIEGIKIGNAENREGGTGCTVIICEKGAVPGVDVRGGAPATRETDSIAPKATNTHINAVMLSGGSAFGLSAADGVMKYLEEKGIGFKTGYGVVPLVVGASIFDLNVGDKSCRPDPEMGYEACKNSEYNEVREGLFGAGMGATVGKLRGDKYKMKSGLGTYAVQQGSVKVGAIAVVNALGTILDLDTGKPIAGLLNEEKDKIISTSDSMWDMVEVKHDVYNVNTTISCIITNAKLTKAQCSKLASIAHNGYAKVIDPVHTSADGDLIFVLSTEEVEVYPDALGVIATEVVARAINRAVLKSDSVFGIKASKDFF